MAIVQISKIQQRSGNLVDLPQLDNAEFGWASDQNRLYIGRTDPGPNENIEVLTSYSNISFSQLDGAEGNLDINNAENGQVLAFDGDNWVNKGGNAGGLLTFGNIANVKIDGGADGYVVTTDGTGNLSFTPKTTIIAYIQNAESTLLDAGLNYATSTDGTTEIITLASNFVYTPNTAVVFTGTGFGNITSGNTYYIRNVISNTSITISDTLGGANFDLTTGTGNLTMQLLGTEITTEENNFFVNGSIVTITDTPGMVQLNGNTYYTDILTSNTLSLYTDVALTIPLVSSNFNAFPYTSVTQTSDLNSNNIVTIGNTSLFANNQPIEFVGTTFGNIEANVQYYVKSIVNAGAPGNIQISAELLPNGAAGNIVQLANANGTCNVFGTGGRMICSTGGGGTSTAGGSNTQIQFNTTNLLDGDPNFTYDYISSVVTLNGNANVSNLNATGTVTASRLVSNIANGTAPLTVTSVTRVANLNVSYSNVSDFEVVTTQTTGTFYPVFVNGNTTANYALGSNANIAFNAATGNLSATLLNANGNLTAGNIITSGNANLAKINLSGHIIPTANITYDLGNSTNAFRDLYLSGTSIKIGSQSVTSNSLGITLSNAVYSTTLSVTANANVGNLGVSGVIVTTGNVSGGNVTTTGVVSATGNVSGGNLTTAGVVTATGNVTGGNLVTSGAANVGSLKVNGVSNLGPISNLVISGGTANQIIKTDGSGNLTFTNPTGGYYLHTQSSASTTWTIVHNLNNQYVSVNPIDNTGNSYVGRYDFPVVNYTNANAVILTFSSAVTGYCAIVGGGFTYANGGGNSTPGGLDTYVQFNDGGVLGGQPSLTFNKTTGTLSATLFAGSGANLTNLNASNISTGTLPSARLTGSYSINITGSAASATTAGTVTTAAQPNITSVGTLTSLTVSGNTTTGGIKTDNYYYANGVAISFAGSYSNSNVASYLPTYTGNITANNITATGNVTAANFVGSGAGTPTLSSATNLDLSAAAAVRVIGGGVFRLPNLTDAQRSNITAANGDMIYNTTSSRFQAYQAGAWSNVGDLTTTIITTGANSTAGSITGNWTLTSGSRLQSTYADLAEYYQADGEYQPGTVLQFGGDKEVTIADDATNKVAGVVSTNPAYAMNANCKGIAVAIALQGRVPVKVRGTIRKGDMMISGGNGYARPTNNPMIGTVIGKALENFDGIEGVIEIAVGRL